LGAIVGAAVIGLLSDKYGRRNMVLLSAVIFALGSISSSLANNVVILTISRIILGTAVGGASALVPLYLAEMAPAKYKRYSFNFKSTNDHNRYFICIYG
jgi:MFS family permease